MPRAAYLRSSLFLAAALWMVAAASAQAQSTSCKPLNDSGQALLNWVRSVATGSDSTWIRARATTRIPQVSANQVSYVTDNKICQSAVSAYAVAANVPATGRQAYVVKAGSYYVVKDPTVWSGEWWFTVTTDRKFVVLAKYGG
jgi:hypothetical protein